MEISIINQKKEVISNFLLDKFWEEDYSSWAVNLAHRHYLANQRQGTSKAKSRGEVRGSTRKINPQKKTGKARHGHRYAPQFRGGGIAFGPSGEKRHSFKINQNVKIKALQSILSKKMENKKVMIVKEIKLDNCKTQEASNFLQQLGLKKRVLLIFSFKENEANNLKRAFRNLPHVFTTNSMLVNTYQVLTFQNILFTSAAFEEVEKRLKNNA